jgi:alpha(1,3/1,4) fucosyltransferase
MNIGCWNFYENLNTNNSLFLNPDAGIGDNLLLPFNKLYLYGEERGVYFKTLDVIEDFTKIDTFIFFDYPDMSNKYVKMAFKLNTPKYLVIFESPIIKPDNWNTKNHYFFKKIFTWNDKYVDNQKYFKINLPSEFGKSININNKIDIEQKMCVVISGNKRVENSLELYSKRQETIRWFERNHLEDFDLYGYGWDKYVYFNRYVNSFLNKFKIPVILSHRYPSYKGAVKVKKSVLEMYKFSICYENARDISGYVTEKIFDCFSAGCVPIYWGAEDITQHVPGNCFIDRRDFDNHESLYEYISEINDCEYKLFLENINLFLKSDMSDKFRSSFFIDTIMSNLE